MAETSTNIHEEQLLAQMGWVRELARRLVSDPGLADDVAQEAWLASRAAPAGLEGEGAIRAWLTTVVRNLIGKSARAEARRRRREAMAARPERTDATADIVERGAMHRELTDCVMRLDEPYRTAVLLRYLEGLSAPEVAARQGIAPAAARKRLSRASEQLRAALDRSHGGDRRAWAVPLVALARTGSSTQLGATAFNARALIAFIVNKATLAAVVLIAVVSFVTIRSLRGFDPSTERGDAGQGVLADPALAGPQAPPGLAPVEPGTNARAEAESSVDGTDPATDARSGWIVTMVDGAGQPVVGASVDARLQIGFGEMRLGRKIAEFGPTAADGRVFIEDVLASVPAQIKEGMEQQVEDVQLVPSGLFGATTEREGSGTDSPAVSIDPSAPSPPVEVMLVRPDSGRVRIDVRSPGQPLPEDFALHLTEGVSSYMTGSVLVRPLPAGGNEASVTFQGIGLGRQLEAELRGPGGASLGKCTLEGPASKDETAIGTLELDAARRVLRGRALGLANQPLTIDLRGKLSASSTLDIGRARRVAQVTVGEDGDFAIEAPWLTAPRPVFATLEFRDPSRPARIHQTSLQLIPGEPVVDVGAFTLEPLPVAIAGRVTDEAGHGIEVTIEMEFTPSPDAGVAWGRCVETLVSDADGTFSYSAGFPDGVVQLYLRSDTHVLPGGTGELRNYPVGKDDVELVMTAVGWIQVDDSALPEGYKRHFSLHTRRSDLDDEAAKASRELFMLGREPKLGPVGSGPLRVELEAWGVGVVGAWDIQLPPGGTFDLGALVPDRALHGHTVVIDTDQERLDPALRVMGRMGGRTIVARSAPDGLRHTFLTTAPIERVFLGEHGPGEHGEGHGNAVQHEVTGETTHLTLD